MKFDLVLRTLWIIWLVQEIREPNHADHVIGHLVDNLSIYKNLPQGSLELFHTFLCL